MSAPPSPTSIARPIAYLAIAPDTLWVEVIDQDATRDRLWVRPLALLRTPVDLDADALDCDDLEPDDLERRDRAIAPPQSIPYTLGDCPDLVLPKAWFHLALDTDALPLLSLLAGPPTLLKSGEPARLAFTEFLQRLWASAPHP